MNNNHNNELQRLLEDAFERLLTFFKAHKVEGMIRLQPVINDEIEKNNTRKTFNYLAKLALLKNDDTLKLNRVIHNFDKKFRSMMKRVHADVICHKDNKAYLTEEWEKRLKRLFFESMKNDGS